MYDYYVRIKVIIKIDIILNEKKTICIKSDIKLNTYKIFLK